MDSAKTLDIKKLALSKVESITIMNSATVFRLQRLLDTKMGRVFALAGLTLVCMALWGIVAPGKSYAGTGVIYVSKSIDPGTNVVMNAAGQSSGGGLLYAPGYAMDWNGTTMGTVYTVSVNTISPAGYRYLGVDAVYVGNCGARPDGRVDSSAAGSIDIRLCPERQVNVNFKFARNNDGATCTRPARTPTVDERITAPGGGSSLSVQHGTASVGLQYWFGGEVCRTDEAAVGQSWMYVRSATITAPDGTTGTVSGLADQLLTVTWTWQNGFRTFDTQNFNISPAGGFTQSGTYTIRAQGYPLNYFPSTGEHICIVDVTRRVGGYWDIQSCSPATTTFNINITVSNPPQTVDCTLTASPSVISPGGSSTLTWTSSGGTSWGFTDSANPVGPNGSRVVSPTVTTTYYYLVVGPGGSRTCPATVTVSGSPPPPPPTCMITASPGTISLGGSASVYWSSIGASAASLNGSPVNPNNYSPGTTVSPTGDTVYTLTVYGDGGTATCQTQITVTGGSNPNAPSCTLVPSPTTIQSGQQSTITWNTLNASSFTVDGTNRAVGSGSFNVNPAATTTYTGTVTGAGGLTGTCSGTVVVEATGPYYKVYGGDVSVGNGFGDPCTTTPGATILAFNQFDNPNYVGAGTQLAAFALDAITDFASSQVRTPTVPRTLTFANTTAGTTYGGNFGESNMSCIPNYWAGASNAAGSVSNPVDLDGLSGAYSRTFPQTVINGGEIRRGQRTTLYVTGNVRITDDITYQSGNYANVGEIPSFRLVVRGNIYIDPGVEVLNGTFVAMPRDGVANSGKIYTCADDFSAPRRSFLRTRCDNRPLTVYGAFVADIIKFTRNVGNVTDAEASERYNNNAGEPAERFIYTPESWLTSDFGGGGGNDAYISLPPVL